MKIDELKLFLDVAHFGSFAKAAEQHGIDPSSISRQISNLESQLGYRLFERTTRRLSLTEAGQFTFDQIQAPLEELDLIFARSKDKLTAPSGLLRVTASVVFGERWLTPRLQKFQEVYPDIKLDLVLTDRNIDLVAENVDIAIRLGERISGSYIVSKLMQTRYRVVASKSYIERYSHPASPAELANHNCMVFSLPGFGSTWYFREDEQEISEIEVSGGIKMTSPLGLRRAALDGMGIALLSDWTIDDDLNEGTLIDLFPNWSATATSFDTAAWILYPSRAYMPAKVRVFIDHMRAEI